jgi:D-alanyl-D-alanine carboxypeptidase (penicillin-binding protein 5/6)
MKTIRFGVCAVLLLAAAAACSCQIHEPQPQTRREPVGRVTASSSSQTNAPTWIPPQAPPRIVGESAIVVEIGSGRVLYAKNADLPRPVASTQKIVTALCVLQTGDLDRVVRITPDDANCEPTKLGLRPGDAYTRRELVKALMVKSANDVGRALARDVGGSQQGFSIRMNRMAAALGMRNSNFLNPHGLTEPGQHSTARDMAIAARAAYRSPLLRSFASTKGYTFRYSDGRTRMLQNTNKVLKTLPYCNGMKTGTTNASGRCLVSTGSLGGRDVIVVVLKSNSANIWSDSEKLLRWALERPVTDV